MKHTIIFTMIFTLIFTFVLCLNAGELGNQNLKGIRYIIPAAQFNGVLYGEGYEDPAEETVKEFNLEGAFAKLKSAGIPLSKENIRGIYKQMEVQLQKAGLGILKMKKYTDEKTTVIPTLTANIDIMAIGGGVDMYATVIHLTLSKWISNWAGSTRILAPVYTWSEKKLTAAPPAELLKTIETAVNQLTAQFIQELKEANS
ncbi:MAG TPA: hypothetical protein VK469_11325 [Candidatus Kapabacteria bacterium]|nr:hypothetical protein [Candidatus Kapabacteria bacterium]